jgi:hypothetical protein
MAGKPLKSVAGSQASADLPPRPVHRPDADALRRVVTEAGRSVPPAVVRPTRRSVLINVKVSEDLAIALAERAEAEGVTQKQVITRALAAAGLPVDALDLEDRSPKRRRGA